MATSDETGFATEVVFYVENEVGGDAFITGRGRGVETDVFEGVVTLDLVHFSLDCRLPQTILMGSIEPHGVVPCLRNLYAKLIACAIRLEVEFCLMRHPAKGLNLGDVFVEALPTWCGQ